MAKTVFDKLKEGLTLDDFAKLLVYETLVEEGDYDYEENYVTDLVTRYKVTVPEEYKKIAKVYLDLDFDLSDMEYYSFEEAYNDVKMLLEVNHNWQPNFDKQGNITNGAYNKWLEN